MIKIAISGASGFVGNRLTQMFRDQGEVIVALSRKDIASGDEKLFHLLEGCDAVINLAGEPISKRWTKAYMQAIVDSRVQTTQRLVAAMGLMQRPPPIFISTSGISAYQSQGQYTEAEPGNATDFMGELAHRWEAAALEANHLGVRTLIFRFALVLGSTGGLLKQLLPPFKLGLGGVIGNGRQHFSWIHIDDLVDCYRLALDNPEMRGIYHLSAPHPVSNRDFTKALGRLLSRPTIFPLPVAVLQLLFGKGAEVMSSGQWVTSARLPDTGFAFKYPRIEDALQQILTND